MLSSPAVPCQVWLCPTPSLVVSNSCLSCCNKATPVTESIWDEILPSTLALTSRATLRTGSSNNKIWSLKWDENILEKQSLPTLLQMLWAGSPSLRVLTTTGGCHWTTPLSQWCKSAQDCSLLTCLQGLFSTMETRLCNGQVLHGNQSRMPTLITASQHRKEQKLSFRMSTARNKTKCNGKFIMQSQQPALTQWLHYFFFNKIISR